MIAALILGFIPVIPQAAYPQASAPWLGEWQLDHPAGETYKRTVLSIASTQSGLEVTYDMVGTRGGTTHIEWVGAFDGRDYPVQGVDTVLTNAYSLTGTDSYEIIVKLDGQVVATTRVSVSPDSQSLAAVTTEARPEGEAVTTTSVYERR